MLLIRNANVYSPAPMGRKDVLIEGDKVIKIADRIAGDYSELNVKTVEAEGKTLVRALSISTFMSSELAARRALLHGLRKCR